MMNPKCNNIILNHIPILMNYDFCARLLAK